MKSILTCLLFSGLLFISSCKKKDHQEPESVSLSDLFQVNSSAQEKFASFLLESNGNVSQAFAMTAALISGNALVDTAYVIDGVYLNIHLKSGLRTALGAFETDSQNRSMYRGGSGSSALMQFGSGNCSNKITNKKVLIYAAAYSNFYSDAEMNDLVKMIEGSSEKLEVTLLKDAQCTPQVLNTFKDYGLVILNTHGKPDGFMTGTKLRIPKNLTNEDEVRNDLKSQVGEELLNRIADGSVECCTNIYFNPHKPEWWRALRYTSEIFVYSKYIQNFVPDMPNTILLGNMCYSGYMAPAPQYGIDHPIGPAILSKKVLAYYAYGRDDNRAYVVRNDFAKACEDSLLHSLLFDLDSTGNAHLSATGSEFKQEPIPNVSREQFFKLHGAKNYCYGCGGSFKDVRDGKTYHSVCIGDQVWMAENLAYEAPGSKCWDNNSSNCVTYGRLYSWATLMNGAASSDQEPSGVKGICPDGWHIPSIKEWNALITLLGGIDLAGGKLKSMELWDAPNTGATASSVFKALPSGIFNGIHWSSKNLSTWLWSATEASTNPENVQAVYLSAHSAAASIVSLYKSANGGSETLATCRCVKD